MDDQDPVDRRTPGEADAPGRDYTDPREPGAAPDATRRRRRRRDGPFPDATEADPDAPRDGRDGNVLEPPPGD